MRDFGFAPNPFHGICTLATCKPEIRKAAQIGDWVIGTGSKSKGRERHLVYAMRVSEAMSFSEYWNDPRFIEKRPDLYSSKQRAFGDNIYHRHQESGEWSQMDSHHSLPHGVPNTANIERDTKADRVLVSDDFIYWGGSGPKFPLFAGTNIRQNGQNHRSHFHQEVVDACIAWLRGRNEQGYCGHPLDW